MDSPLIYWLKCNDLYKKQKPDNFCELTKVLIHFYGELQRLFANL